MIQIVWAGVSPWTIIPSALFCGISLFVVVALLRTRKEKYDRNILNGWKKAVVVGTFTEEKGRVHIDGEYWNAQK